MQKYREHGIPEEKPMDRDDVIHIAWMLAIAAVVVLLALFGVIS